MLQVLSREKETILVLLITGIFKIASYTGDLQWNPRLGTSIQGTLL